jgi:hypothetical protein
MCMGGGGGPSKAARAQEIENERLAEEREKERRAQLTNPEDKLAQLEKNLQPLRRQGRRGLKIDLTSDTSNNSSGLSIK